MLHIRLHQLHRALYRKDEIKQSSKHGKSKYKINPDKLICVVRSADDDHKAYDEADKVQADRNASRIFRAKKRRKQKNGDLHQYQKRDDHSAAKQIR